MTAGSRDMCGAGIVPNREGCGVAKVCQGGKLGAADEVDRGRASYTDFSGKLLLSPSPDNDRKSTGCL